MEVNHKAPESYGGLLPHLCANSFVFGLILAGELLALALVLVQDSLLQFSWSALGYVSIVVQWIVLLSALILCQMSRFLSNRPVVLGGAIAYATVLLIALAVLSVACILMGDTIWSLIKNMLLAGILSGIFLRYLYLQQQLRNQQQAELQSRIQALHARIRPHFLFNSMNAVASLIPVDPDMAEKVVEDLCEIFRISLQETSMVSLEQEIDLCRSYVDIEKVRLGDRLQVEWDIQHQQRRVSVPSLVLQPLIENAICHGIQRIVDGGTVFITSRTEGNILSVSVINPLPVLDESKTDNLPSLKSNSMALNNIRHRLHAHYGENATIETKKVTSDTGGQYEVTLTIIVKNNEE